MENEPSPEERKSPVVEVTIGQLAIRFTYMDTVLVEFKNFYQDDNPLMDFSHMNNIHTITDEGEELVLYDSPHVFEELSKLCFEKLSKPYPDEDDIESYANYFGAFLDGEVNLGDGL